MSFQKFCKILLYQVYEEDTQNDYYIYTINSSPFNLVALQDAISVYMLYVDWVYRPSN